MTQADIERLVSEYADAIVKQRQAIKTGTTKDVRRYASKITPIAKKLLAMGEDGRRGFAVLLQHPDREIRATAGVHLFSSMPQEVLAMFKDLAQGDDLIAMGAQMRIKEWEEHPEHYDESNWV